MTSFSIFIASRLVASRVNLALCKISVEKDDCTPLWVVCDGKDPQASLVYLFFYAEFLFLVSFSFFFFLSLSFLGVACLFCIVFLPLCHFLSLGLCPNEPSLPLPNISSLFLLLVHKSFISQTHRARSSLGYIE